MNKNINKNNERIRYVLFVSDGNMSGQLNQEAMQKVYDFVFSLEDINLYFKGHKDEINTIPETVKQLEVYVPCELFLKYFDLVVSCFSSVMIYSIKIGIPTISYIKLMKDSFYDKSLYTIWKNRLDSYGDGKILYPSSFVELESMIRKINNKDEEHNEYIKIFNEYI